MNEFDQFIKHILKVKNYIRYTDDFLIISENKNYLQELIPEIKSFLLENLKLNLHPQKVTVTKHIQGIDFLGYIIFPHYRLLQKKTKKRIIRKLQYRIKLYKQNSISRKSLNQTFQSYLGVLSHADEYRFTEHLKNQFWFWLNE